MQDERPRISRESSTVSVMIEMYCRDHHGPGGLCRRCRELRDYSLDRLDKCPFQEGKTTCAQCPVHCYRPEMRAEIRAVMRYSGPRMIYSHPVMAIQHITDGRRKEPVKKEEAAG